MFDNLVNWLLGTPKKKTVRRKPKSKTTQQRATILKPPKKSTSSSIKPKLKRIFISFAIEDSEYRDHLVSQARKKHSPFEFIDMSVKKKWEESEWQKKCRTKIRGCDGVIALLSNCTYHASGARWEMKCAQEEGIPIIGMHIRKNDKYSIPPELSTKKVIEWSWANLEKFINKL